MRAGARRQASHLDMPEILLIKTSSLGDVIHQMPALTEARAQRPNARFSWVVEETYAPLVRLHPAAAEVIPVATRRWRRTLYSPSTWGEIRAFKQALRERTYDEVIDTQGLIRTGLIAKLARGRRHGYDAQSIKEPLAARFYDLRHAVSRDMHAIARNRMLTGRALGYIADGPADYGLTRRAHPAAYAVLLHATARAEKLWPEEHWREIGGVLSRRGIEVVLPWGTQDERARSDRLALALPDARVPPRQPLDRMAQLIAGAALVVGVDTGLLHLAAAFGVPLVAIFTGSEPALTGPRGAGPMEILGRNGAPPSPAEVLGAIERVV
jgi:lipopolysaccharide heptosyltransferase I